MAVPRRRRRALPLKQEEILLTGHAVEARLYAENPASGFLPSIGRLEAFSLPTSIRVDTAVEAGDAISPHYDPMIAKLIVHAATREDAIADLAEACSEVDIWPVKTNAGFLVRCLESPDFIVGSVDTSLIARDLDVLTAPPEPSPEVLATAGWAFREVVERHAAGQAATPWVELLGFRLNAAPQETVRVFLGDTALHVPMPLEPTRVLHVPGDEEVVVFEGGEAFVFRDHPPIADAAGSAGDGSIRAPMPGKITLLSVKPGDTVVKGQALLTLEAMKMEHGLIAPFDGVVDEVTAEVGAQVSEGAVLAKLTAA